MNEDRLEELRGALARRLNPQQLDIVDDSAAHAGHAGAREGGHFRVRIVSAQFRGRSLLERHRLVYEAVGGLMGNGVHALVIVAHSPDESLS